MSTIETKTIPLATEDIISFFDKPDHFFYIDYVNSTLKKDNFLAYIANMKMQCDLLDYKAISSEDRIELLSSFMKYPFVIEIPTLKNALVSVLLYTRSGEMAFDYLSKEEAETFVSNHKNEIEHASCFFDSMLLVLPSMSNEFREEIFDKLVESNELELVEDPNAIGINTFLLTIYPDFLDMFIGLGKEAPKIKYYKYAIEKFNYKNKKLFQLIIGLEKPSVLMSIFNMLSSKEDLETEYFEKLKAGA